METENCNTEGCVGKVSVNKLCKSCYKKNFLNNSIKSFEEKKEKKLISKELCIGKTLKGEPCIKQKSEECGNFCKVHYKMESKKEESLASEEPKIKCKGFTTKQTPCLRYESFNCEGYCIQHFKVQKKEEKIEEKLNKLKL